MKLSKTAPSVAYVALSPHADERCGNCSMFRPGDFRRPNLCTAVTGMIRYEAWCRLWAALDQVLATDPTAR